MPSPSGALRLPGRPGGSWGAFSLCTAAVASAAVPCWLISESSCPSAQGA